LMNMIKGFAVSDVVKALKAVLNFNSEGFSVLLVYLK
jgi:hypothetical protein